MKRDSRISRRKAPGKMYSSCLLAALLVVGLGGCPVAHAESASGNSSASGSGGSSLANQITQSSLQSPVSVQYDQANNSNGRAYKAGSAQKGSNAGLAAGLATGSALTMAGVPMLGASDPVVQAAGAQLLSQAAQEFTQAAADGGASNQNGSAKNAMKNATGDTSSQAGNSVASSLLTPQLDQLLSQRGVNSQDFVNQLASGQLTSPADILKAAGAGDISPDALQQGSALANSRFNNITAGTNAAVNATPEPLGDGGKASTDYDTSGLTTVLPNIPNPSPAVIAPAMASLGGTSFGPIGLAVASAPQLFNGGVSPGAMSSSAPASSSPAKAAGHNTAGAAARGVTGPPPLTGDAQASVLAAAAANSLANLKGTGVLEPSEIAALDRFSPGTLAGTFANPLMAHVFLGEIGIQRLPPRQNIFQTAHHNYHSFGKWRHDSLLADRRVPHRL